MDDVVARTDYSSVYGEIGSKVTIDMVSERDGVAYATVEGKEYASHYLYGGPTQKFVGEKKIRFADYRRWIGL